MVDVATMVRIPVRMDEIVYPGSLYPPLHRYTRRVDYK